MDFVFPCVLMFLILCFIQLEVLMYFIMQLMVITFSVFACCKTFYPPSVMKYNFVR